MRGGNLGHPSLSGPFPMDSESGQTETDEPLALYAAVSKSIRAWASRKRLSGIAISLPAVAMIR